MSKKDFTEKKQRVRQSNLHKDESKEVRLQAISKHGLSNEYVELQQIARRWGINWPTLRRQDQWFTY